MERYHCRWNPTLQRKEWRRIGRPTLVVGGDIVNPGTLTVSMSSSPTSPVSSGVTVTLTTTATLGTSPYSYAWSQTSGTAVTLSGSGATRTFTSPVTSSNLGFKVIVTDSASNTQETTISIQVEGSVQGTQLYATHIPNRVILGFAAPQGDTPDWDGALALIKARATSTLGSPGVGSYEWRRFSSTGTNGTQASELRGMLNDADAVNQIPWVSFKVTGTDWNGVAAGNYPAIPAMFRTLANERASQGKKPFIATLHHEPRGDHTPLSDWSLMHIYMSNQLADINDKIAWSCIGNGFLWNSVGGNTTDRNAEFPQALIDTFRINKHLVAVDTYDDHPTYTGQQSYPVGSQNNRCSVKLQNWIDWMRARNCGALGIGEWSTTDVAEMKLVAATFWRNRDILGIANYFNSIAGGSTWDWRLIPSNYPSYPSNPGLDYGGTNLTDGRLGYFPQMLLDSVKPANTGPL